MAKAKSIADLKYYRNRTKQGNPTATKVRRTVAYHAYGAGPRLEEEAPQMRGEWVGPAGVTEQGEVTEWAAAHALEYKYTYLGVLSVRAGRLSAADYNQVMQAAGLFQDWRLMPHRDTDYDHAHVILFRDKVLSRREAIDWNKRARQELVALSQAQADRLSAAEIGESDDHDRQAREREQVRRMMGMASDYY